MLRVAMFTFGILREASEHPQMQGFFDRDPHVFAAAEQSDGFIARSGYEGDDGPPIWGEKAYPRFFDGIDDDWTPATLTLWEDLESVIAFAYFGLHDEALKRGREWFKTPAWPTHAAWWVSPDHIPQWIEAKTRHEYLHDHGPSPYAFDLQHPFGPEESPIEVNRELVKAKVVINHQSLEQRAMPGVVAPSSREKAW